MKPAIISLALAVLVPALAAGKGQMTMHDFTKGDGISETVELRDLK